MSLFIPALKQSNVVPFEFRHPHSFLWKGYNVRLDLVFIRTSEGWYTEADLFLENVLVVIDDDVYDYDWSQSVWEIFGRFDTFLIGTERKIEVPDWFTEMVERRLEAFVFDIEQELEMTSLS